MADYFDELEELLDAAEEAAAKDDAIKKARAENRVIGDVCDMVAEMSAAGEMEKTQVNALASQLSEIVDNYTKTDIKNELKPHFVEKREGKRFDEVIENRLEEVRVVHSTDHKQGTVWRWRFSDGVELETDTSGDGGREHYSWSVFKRLYFDELVSQGQGEKLAEPDPNLLSGGDWTDWIDDLILEHSTTVEHVGPRTEAVRLLRDLVQRSPAYHDMDTVRERQGLWIEPENGGDKAATDGGEVELRVPVKEIKRICDQQGISTRALQIELQARGLTCSDRSGVSDAAYVDGVRVPYWALTTALAEPDAVIEEPSTPAEVVAEEEAERLNEEQTSVGAVSDDDLEQHDNHTGSDRDSSEADDSDGDDDTEPGVTDSFGSDPDGGDSDE